MRNHGFVIILEKKQNTVQKVAHYIIWKPALCTEFSRRRLLLARRQHLLENLYINVTISFHCSILSFKDKEKRYIRKIK